MVSYEHEKKAVFESKSIEMVAVIISNSFTDMGWLQSIYGYGYVGCDRAAY